MQKIILTLFLFIFLFAPSIVICQDNDSKSNVYLIRIPQTVHHRPRTQTGFRLNGTKGIITTLHGLTDADLFSAVNDNNQTFVKLKIKAIDVANDVALLSCRELEQAGIQAGLKMGKAKDLKSFMHMLAIGHPLGIDTYNKGVFISIPVTRKLASLIPPVNVQIFSTRNSPSPEINVFNIDGNLEPGNSGSPLVNDSMNKVYGVIDGGLLSGAGISWAIQLDKIKWSFQMDEISELNRLANLPESNLFSYDEDVLVTVLPQKNIDEIKIALDTTYIDNANLGIVYKAISDLTGIKINFNLVQCDSIDDPAGKKNSKIALHSLKAVPATNHNTLYYNPEYFYDLRDSTHTYYSILFVLVHEAAHLYLGHVFVNGKFSASDEIDADRFAGFILGRLNTPLVKTLSIYKIFFAGYADRMQAAKEGWQKGLKQQ